MVQIVKMAILGLLAIGLTACGAGSSNNVTGLQTPSAVSTVTAK
jgi:hypothetical protein